MAALSAAYDKKTMDPREGEARLVYATADTFYSGGLVEMDPGTGLVSPLGTGNAASYFYGVCEKTKTTAASSDSTVSVLTYGEIVKSVSVTGVTGDSDHGRVVYCSSDNIADATLVATPGTTRAIGTVYHHVSSTTCHIRLFSAVSQTERYNTGLAQVYSSVEASADHENTTTEAIFDENYTIPANTLAVGDTIKIRAFGTVTDSNSTDTLTCYLRIGGLTGTAIATTAAVDVADSDIFVFDSVLTIRTIGATGTVVGSTSYQDPDAAGTAPKWSTLAETAIDTTADQQVCVSADWSVAHADNEANLDQLVVEVIHRANS